MDHITVQIVLKKDSVLLIKTRFRLKYLAEFKYVSCSTSICMNNMQRMIYQARMAMGSKDI